MKRTLYFGVAAEAVASRNALVIAAARKMSQGRLIMSAAIKACAMAVVQSFLTGVVESGARSKDSGVWAGMNG